MSNWKPTLKVEGLTVPLPDNYSQTIADLSSAESGRLLNGMMVKDTVAVKTTIPMEWTKLEWNVASQLARAVDGKNEIKISYVDVRNPYKMTEKTVYVGDRTFQIYDTDSDGKVYWSVKFNEIEV